MCLRDAGPVYCGHCYVIPALGTRVLCPVLSGVKGSLLAFCACARALPVESLSICFLGRETHVTLYLLKCFFHLRGYLDHRARSHFIRSANTLASLGCNSVPRRSCCSNRVGSKRKEDISFGDSVDRKVRVYKGSESVAILDILG